MTSKVLLCSLPFGSIEQPALSLTSLKGALLRHGLDCDVRYLCLQFANRIGPSAYIGICETSWDWMLGEWIFAAATFDTIQDSNDSLLEQLHTLQPGEPTNALEVGKRAREQVEPFLQECLEQVDWSAYDMIGFTITYHQLNSSLALSKRLKLRYPHLVILFGGYGIDAEMGRAILQTFPCVDYVFLGESEKTLPAFVQRLRRSEPLDDVPSLVFRRVGTTATHCDLPGLIDELDSLPFPDFDDFTEQFHATFGQAWRGILNFEAVRGCPWGEAGPCTFCGVYNLRYRGKSPQRIQQEIEWLYNRYHPLLMVATDSLSQPRLEKTLSKVKTHCPAAAFSVALRPSISKAALRRLKIAGVIVINVGVESFSTPILRLMHKGVSALTNLQLLKWCRELGLLPGWNLIYGFPGEEPDEYERMSRLIPLINHLTPPMAFGPLYLFRFSSYFYHPHRYGLANLRPAAIYEHVLPGISQETTLCLASFFSFDYADQRNPVEYTRSMKSAVDGWYQAAENSLYAYVDDGQRLRLFDTRPIAHQAVQNLTGLERAIYLACDNQQSLMRLAQQFADSPLSRLKAALNDLVEAGWMVSEDERYLSLAVNMGQYLDLEQRRFASDDFWWAIARGLFCSKKTILHPTRTTIKLPG